MKLGLTSKDVFMKTDFLAEKSTISTVYVLGFMVALLLWAFGLVWLFFALASIFRCKKFPFNIGWWGFTFPLGAYSLATCQIGEEMNSSFFKILGTVRITDKEKPMTSGASWLIEPFIDTFVVCRHSLGGGFGRHVKRHYLRETAC